MSVYHLCSRKPETVNSDESLRAAAERMKSRGVGTLVVVDAENRPLAMITDRDLAIRGLTRQEDPDRLTVRDCMSPNVLAIPQAASIESALGAMRSGPHRRLPVVEENGTLCGVISVDDVVRHLISEFHLVSDLLSRETPDALAQSREVT